MKTDKSIESVENLKGPSHRIFLFLATKKKPDITFSINVLILSTRYVLRTLFYNFF